MYKVQADLVGTGEHCYLYLERDGRKTTQPDIPDIIHQFDNLIYPKLHDVYGNEPDWGVGKDSKVHILLLDIRDDWNGSTITSYIAGYFYPMDQSTTWQYSNQKNILYMDIYPGSPNPLYPSPLSNRYTIFRHTMAHEFQHMIHWNKTNGRNVNNKWLNEAMSEVASFYAFNEPSWESVSYFESRDPAYNITYHSDSLTEWNSEFADYPVVYMWAQYMADRFDDKSLNHYVFRSILDNNTTNGQGIISVQAYLDSLNQGFSFASVFRDWSIAVFFGDNNTGTWRTGSTTIINPVSTNNAVWTYKTINTWPGSYGSYNLPGMFGHAPKYDSFGRPVYNLYGDLNDPGNDLRKLDPWSLGYYWKTKTSTLGSDSLKWTSGGSKASLFYNPMGVDTFEFNMISGNTYTYDDNAYLILQNAQNVSDTPTNQSISQASDWVLNTQQNTLPTPAEKLRAFSQSAAALSPPPTRGSVAEPVPVPVCIHDILSQRTEEIQRKMQESKDTH